MMMESTLHYLGHAQLGHILECVAVVLQHGQICLEYVI